MPAVLVAFEASGDPFKDLRSRGGDLGPQMRVLAADMAAAVVDRFDSGNFQALAPSTLRRKLAAGKSAQPLIFNGTWRNTHGESSGTDWAALSTNVPYAVFHVSDAPRSKIPLRNPYDLGSEFWEQAYARLGEYIATGKVQ